jgi:anti-sigma B factor antagonist
MEINHKTLDKVQIVELVGRIDAINNAKAEEFFNQITENQQFHIVVDCENLDYINSSGLRVFIMSLKKSKKANKELLICNLQKNIKEVFQYSGFDNLFNIHLNREEAINKIN